MGARGPAAKSPTPHNNAGFASGAPRMPKGLNPEAKAVWEFVCEQIPAERSSPADKLALLGLAKWFAHWSELMETLEVDRGDARMQRQAANAWQMVEQLLRQFGLTLNSRARLPAGKPDDGGKENPLLKLHKLREARRKA